MFRSIFAERTCEHCSKSQLFEVQFKTGFDCCETYKPGELVAPDEGFDTDQTYPGCVDRYCDQCLRRWRIDQRSSMLESLAQLIETEGLKVREEGSERWLSAGELRTQKGNASPQHSLEEPSEGEEPEILFMRSPCHFDLVWKGVKVKFPNDAYHEYDRALGEHIDRILHDHGWASGRDFIRTDLLVYLDDDYRIRVA